MVAAPASVLREQFFAPLAIDERRGLRIGPEDVGLKAVGVRTGEPRADRRREPVLRQTQNLVRYPALGYATEQALRFKAWHLSRHWYAEREFDDPAIEQRTTDFEAVCHAHPIDFHKDVVRQVHH